MIALRTKSAASGASRGRKRQPARGRLGHAVEPEGAPVLAVEVPGEQIPATTGGDEAVGLDAALPLTPRAGIREGDALGLTAGAGEQEQRARVDRRGGRVERHRGLVDRLDLRAQPRREHLVELGEGAHRGLAEALDRAARGEAQAHRHGDGLVVVEQQRREPAPGAELVAAAGAVGGPHGVAELAQPVDVAAHAAGRDAEPLGELGAAPHRAALQQVEQAQRASGGAVAALGRGHASESGTLCGQFLSYMGATHRAMTQTTKTIDWTATLVEQADWHWQHQLRARFEGLTDEEYLWEPTPGRLEHPPARPGQHRDPGRQRVSCTIDFAYPEPVPAPVTTIAWRLAHIIVGVLGGACAEPLRRPGGRLPDLRLRRHRRRRPCPARRRVCRVVRRRPELGRGRSGRAVRSVRGALRRVPPRHARAPHQPRADPPRGRDRPAA